MIGIQSPTTISSGYVSAFRSAQTAAGDVGFFLGAVDNHDHFFPRLGVDFRENDDDEIILITRGHGTLLMGDYIGAYHTGEIYLIVSE